jgi:glycyl-tRNA synthetase beta chain
MPNKDKSSENKIQNNQELLIEIYSEEIPARMQIKALEDFKKIFSEFFVKQNIQIKAENLQSFITPRRLALLVKNLDSNQSSAAISKTGPKIDAPAGAIQGFLRSVGLSDVSELAKITKNNGEYYSYNQPETQIDVAQILEKNIPALLQKMSGTWIKTMDLIDLEKRSNWVRPIRNILAVFNGKILNFEFANLKTNNQTFGHLIAGKKSLQINNFAEYQKQLEENLVILDWKERREIISGDIAKIDPNLVQKNSKLIDEIAGLVEYPQVLVGTIDDQFKALPEEILELVIKMHQKAIVFRTCHSEINCSIDKSHLNENVESLSSNLPTPSLRGDLSTWQSTSKANPDQQSELKFIFVCNIKAEGETLKRIISDNEKVVKARLADAKFYIEEDLKTSFKERFELLRNITFHKKLGSLYYKIKRLEILNKFIVIWVPNAQLSLAERLADLAKNDLSTKTVAELPELQGFIGGYYAKIQDEPKEICEAIKEQYLPTGQNSEIPKTPLGIVLAIADKTDNICGLFLAGEKPTASKDPYALRRAALGIIKIIFENNLSLPLKIIIEKSLNSFPNKFYKELYPDKSHYQIKEIKTKLLEEILQFFIERNKSYLKEQYSIRSDVVNEIFSEALKCRNYDLLEVSGKAIFINQFVNNSNNDKIIELYKRAGNIVAIEEKKDQEKYDGKVSIIALKEKPEKLLYKQVKSSGKLIKKALTQNDYQKALLILADLEPLIKSFFDEVEVNCEAKNSKSAHLRINRLMLLSKIKRAFDSVFDFSKIF